MVEKILLSRKEAAELLSVSLRQIDALIFNGRLESQRIGRRRLISKKSLSEFTEAGRGHSKAEPRQ